MAKIAKRNGLPFQRHSVARQFITESEAHHYPYVRDSQWEMLDPFCSHLSEFAVLSCGSPKTWIEFGSYLIMQRSQKAYSNGKIFAEYIKLVFLPYIAKIRGETEIEQEEIVLLMDNCPLDLISEVVDMLTTTGVRIVTFTPHATHIFQLLDLTSFGTF
jgi:hypothetical protein